MGRITIFSIDDCPHCKRAKAAFDERAIPYSEINLTKYPEKRLDMLSLSDQLTVPQVFLNEKHLGGADDTLKLMERWDMESSPVTAFVTEVQMKKDPVDGRLEVPTYEPSAENAIPAPKRVSCPVVKPAGECSTVVEIMEELKSVLPRDDLKHNLTIYKNSFSGSDAVVALQEHFSLDDRSEAVNLLQSLQQKKFLDHVVGDHDFQDTDKLYYRLTRDQRPDVLNSYRVWTERVDPDSMRLLKQLKKMMSNILSANTDASGKVNYRRAAMSRDFPAFEEAVCELQGVDFRGMPYETKLAFSINLYNLMIKYAFIKVGIGQSSLERCAFFTKVKFQVGPDVFSFQDLENGILRGNRKAPYSLSPQFAKGDPRMDLVMDKVDFRIHFALNCGATSCPPVKNFTKQGIEEELRIVAQAFCEGDEQVRIDVENKTVYLSKIFNWYRIDFGKTNTELLETVLSCLRGKKKFQLEFLLYSGVKNVKVKYNFYDWSTDASDSIAFTSEVLKADVSRFRQKSSAPAPYTELSATIQT